MSETDSPLPAMQISRRIASQLQALGVRPGGVLLVHSSLRSLGDITGGPESVIQGILVALGSEGTLLMPALSYDLVTPVRPFFDIQHTPSNVGAITEHLRTRPGTRRSMHPTHSVCGIGPLSSQLLDAHHLDSTPCGPGSPFHLLPKFRGQILMLGCGLEPNTSMHAIEELVEPPYLYGKPFTYHLQSANGQRREKIYRQHGFANWKQRYDRVAAILDEPDLRSGKVLRAEACLLEATALWQAALTALRQDLLYFVDRVA